MTNKNIFKNVVYDSLNKQVDGSHYKSFKVQPAEFINENNSLEIISICLVKNYNLKSDSSFENKYFK